MTPPHKPHNHPEAFKVMTYQCKAGHRMEIWNSRDGVTPFGVLCRAPGCEETSSHVEWQRDRYEPPHVHRLKPGEWFFRDGTLEEARTIVRRRLELAKGTKYERSESEWDGLIKTIVTGHEFQPGWPLLVRVPPFMPDPELPDPPEDPPSRTLTLWASSGYGANSRQPFVAIRWQDVVHQLSPDEARQFARSIFEAAEAAEQDAFLFEWVKAECGADDRGATNLLRGFREWRERRTHPDGEGTR